MSKDLLFDTSALIDIYKGRNRIRPFQERLISKESQGFISVVSVAELWRGLRVGEVDQHNALLSHFTILPLNAEAAQLAGSWMQAYVTSGLGWMDALIAATSATAGIPMLTRDKRLVTLMGNQVEFSLYE